MYHFYLSSLNSTEFLHGKYFLFGRRGFRVPQIDPGPEISDLSDQVRGGSRKRAMRGGRSVR